MKHFTEFLFHPHTLSLCPSVALWGTIKVSLWAVQVDPPKPRNKRVTGGRNRPLQLWCSRTRAAIGSTLVSAHVFGSQTLKRSMGINSPFGFCPCFLPPSFPFGFSLSGVNLVRARAYPSPVIHSLKNVTRHLQSMIHNPGPVTVGTLLALGVLCFLPSVQAANAVCESNWGWVRTFLIPVLFRYGYRLTFLQSYNSKGQNPCEVAASLQGPCFGQRTHQFHPINREPINDRTHSQLRT